MFSDDSYVNLAQQGVYYSAIEGADDLASERYGNHNDYLVIDCSIPENQNEPGCQANFNPGKSELFAGGGEGVVEFEAFNPENLDLLCEENPQDPLCYGNLIEDGEPGQGDAFSTPPGRTLTPGTQAGPGGFWGDAEKAEEFQNQSNNFTEFADNYCEENPDDPTCSQITSMPPGGDMPPDMPVGQEGVPPGEDDYEGEPPGGDIDCADPVNMASPECVGEENGPPMPPGEENEPPMPPGQENEPPMPPP